MTPVLLVIPAVVIGAFAMLLGTTWLERLIGLRPSEPLLPGAIDPVRVNSTDDAVAPSR
jgi:hypothetical protein